ncbi:unnamed protein product [Mucor hiemalis]
MKLFSKYQSLSIEEQALCGFCLNGILDLSNQRETGQKKLFTNDQWQYLNNKFPSKTVKYLHKLDSDTYKQLKKIVKELKAGNYDEGYYISLDYSQLFAT